MGKWILLIVILLAFPCVNASSSHLKLLAVAETDTGYTGQSADLYLEIKEGTGRVFIESFPLTKMDTQISTRFAKEIACSFTGKDCSKYDFFYTIRADTSIVAGPSASAAISGLTAAALLGLDVNESVTLTGTINSGGIIGPVAGIKEKLEAGSEAGLKKVLIPEGKGTMKIANRTVDLAEYGEMLGLEVREVPDLNTAVYHITGKRVKEEKRQISVDSAYVRIMESIAKDICGRAGNMSRNLPVNFDKNKSMYAELRDNGDNLSSSANSALSNRSYYSAASFCFGANVHYRNLQILLENQTQEQIMERLAQMDRKIELERASVLGSYNTITDLQTYLIVNERLLEAEEHLDTSMENMENNTGEALYNLAFAMERLYTAESWSRFFNLGGREFELDRESLKESCLSKISEAEERLQYLALVGKTGRTSSQSLLKSASSFMKDSNYEMCLFQASQAKAEADMVLNLFGMEEGQLDGFIDRKVSAVENAISAESEKGIFPILAYSYLEYAKSLREKDKFSTLLYLEYGQELSSFDLYFRTRERRFPVRVNWSLMKVFLIGMAAGALLTLPFQRTKSKRKRV